jgi:pilus assembly protein CpaF
MILLQDIFKYRTLPGTAGKMTGELVATGLRPKFIDKLAYANVAVDPALFRTDLS